VFEFTEAVLEDDRWFYAFSEIEALRDILLPDKTMVPITDLGAGSQVSPRKERSIGSLARYSANQPFVCQTLFLLVQHFKPNTLLELGTSLGFSTAYQAAACRKGRMITIEGCPNVARFAAKNLELMKAENVTLLQGSFEEKLPEALAELKSLDYVFVDGNHRREPTLRYFQKCLEFAHDNSVFVFDDIHWSAEMEAAWLEIKRHPRVRISIDLFFFGVVFFRSEQRQPEHFSLVPWVWKPWAIGLGDFFRK
jgi:predicted O-methyltransferase YrrM